MKPTPPPQIEGKTDAERFNNALRKVLNHPPAKSASDKNGTQHQPSQHQRSHQNQPK